MSKVGIVMGSDSDMPVMSKAADILDKLGISYEIIVISYEIPNCSRMSAAFAITGISESLPITIPTKAILTSYVR